MKNFNHPFFPYKSQLLFFFLLLLGACKYNPSTNEQPVADTWYRNAVIYNLDVKAFKDSDGDGIGDFNGLAAKLPYLDSLGVDVIWLSPFHPSPEKDDGYDVTNFYEIDQKLGSDTDFDTFIRLPNRKGYA